MADDIERSFSSGRDRGHWSLRAILLKRAPAKHVDTNRYQLEEMEAIG